MVAECEYLQHPAVALLVPVRSIPPPAPAIPTLYGASDDTAFSIVTLNNVTDAAALALETSLAQLGWDASRVELNVGIGEKKARARKSDIGEGGMYI